MGRIPKYNSTFDPQGEMETFVFLFVDEEMKSIKHHFSNKRLLFKGYVSRRGCGWVSNHHTSRLPKEL